MFFKLAIAVIVGIIVGAISDSVFIGFIAIGVVMYLANKHGKEFNGITDALKQAANGIKQTAEKQNPNPTHKAMSQQPQRPAQAPKQQTSKPAEMKLPNPVTHLRTIVASEAIETRMKEIPMFLKIIIALVLAGVAGFLTHSPGVAVGVFAGAFVIALLVEGMRIVPQQSVWVVERFGKFHEVLEPGFNWIWPFVDRVMYRHSLKEVPLDIPEQVCITRDNTQLAVDGIIYYQVTDPKLASYGSSDYIQAITQLAQTALRSVVGKMELDRTFESRDEINHMLVSVLDEAGRTWGVKVLRYEIKNLTPPESILRAMQAQITAEREKRAVIAKSEGVRQEDINIADGEKQAAVLKSEGAKTATINKAQGEAIAVTTVAEATATAVRQVAAAIGEEGGLQAANLKVAQLYIEAFANLAKTGNTLIIPSNLADVASMVSSAMTVLDKTKSTAPRP
jgi:regulator of protease activity HflC (stomatin/prohibitin superfamily)